MSKHGRISVAQQEVTANGRVQLPRPEAGEVKCVGVFRVPGELHIQGQILSFQAVLGSAGSTGHRPFGGVGRGDGMFMALAEVVCLFDFLREGN